MEHIKNEEIGRCADDCLEASKRLSDCRVLIKDLNYPNNKFPILSKIIKLHIEGAHKIYVILVTVGDLLEKKASRMISNQDYLKGYLFDVIGSLAAESLAESVERALRLRHERKAESLSMRLSPGYCDWPIDEQASVAKIIDFGKIGVKLTDSLMMRPKKSIAFITAAGPKELFKDRKSQCAFCDLKECSYKR